MSLKIDARASRRVWTLSWLVGALIFALIVTWQNRGLTFFWDEWDVAWAAIESPYFGVLQDNGGNFFPLSRVVFAMELAIFGTWYPGYMFITSLLFGAAAFTFVHLLDDGTRTRRIALSSFALIYLSSTGVLFASSMGFMLKWALSPLLAILSATFFIRYRSSGSQHKKFVVLAWLFFFLSWAAFSSAIVLMALLIIGLIHVAEPHQQNKSRGVLQIRLSLLILAISLVVVLIGIRLAELNPPVNPLTGTAQESVETLLSQNPLNTILLATAATFTGIISVLLALPLQSNEIYSWLLIAVRDYLWVILLLVFIVFALIYRARKSVPNQLVSISMLLFFVANLFISATRTPFIHRYQTMWVFIAILVLLAIISWLNSIDIYWIGKAIISITAVAALFSVLHISTNSLSIGNIERQRDIADSRILNDPTQCLNEASRTLSQIAPTMTPARLCTGLQKLKERSWISER